MAQAWMVMGETYLLTIVVSLFVAFLIHMMTLLIALLTLTVCTLARWYLERPGRKERGTGRGFGGAGRSG